jgi:hypothetical protein
MSKNLVVNVKFYLNDIMTVLRGLLKKWKFDCYILFISGFLQVFSEYERHWLVTGQR